MTTKVKNSTQSGAVEKSKKESVVVEVTASVVDATDKTDVVVEATSPKVELTDCFDDCAIAITKDSHRANNVVRRPVEITDVPVVTVAGNRIILKESVGPEDIYSGNSYGYRSSLLAFPDDQLGRRGANRFNATDTVKFKDGWWECKLGGVTIFLTRGSELYLPEHLGTNNWDYEEGVKNKSTLILIGSSIETDSLNVSGYVVLNNASINVAGGYVNLKKSKITLTALSGKGFVEIQNSTLNTVTNYSNENTNIYDSKITNITFGGFKRIDLRKVTNRAEEFNISTWTHGNAVTPELNISNVRLGGFEGVFQQLTPEIATYKDPGKPHATQFNINRRIDYGHFSAKQPIPFIRLGAFDLVVGGEIFKASEFFPTPSTDIYPVAKDVTTAQGPGYLHPYPRYELPSVINTGSTYRGSMLWNRAAKVIFGWSYGKTPIGASGESLVNSLVEQIKSRINLYVEFNNLTE